ncbi:MAG: histidine kinase [Flavobacteriia bacterium]|nr:histidine kinase [Flavobacteriia bacterium]
MSRSKNRFIWMILIGALIFVLLEIMLDDGKYYPTRNRFLDLMLSISITLFVWEGNLILDSKLNIFSPWQHKKAIRRIFLQLLLSSFYTFIVIYFSMVIFSQFICEIPEDRKIVLMKSAIIIGLLVTFIIISIEIGIQFFKKWKQSLIELEKYKTESTQAQLQNLKNQLNPHFLFNNLSVLSSLVYQNQDKAVDFINQLSKVYRYILDNRNTELITISDEMKFLESYFFLLKIRFGENIQITIELNENELQKMIPPLSIQTLVENAIKHNEISSSFPLFIKISTLHNNLVICNNIQLRIQYDKSSKTGLKNIQKRYHFFTDREIFILNDEQNFCVHIPMLTLR